jgi:hypothetical protein
MPRTRRPSVINVEAGEILGQQDRVVHRRHHHRGDQPDVRIDLGGQAGEHRHRLQAGVVAVEEMLADAEVGEAVALGGLDLAQQFGELALRAPGFR